MWIYIVVLQSATTLSCLLIEDAVVPQVCTNYACLICTFKIRSLLKNYLIFPQVGSLVPGSPSMTQGNLSKADTLGPRKVS